MVTGIKELQVSCIIGIYPKERKRKQKVCVDIEWQGEFVDYDHVATFVETFIKNGRYELLEKLAEDLLEALLETFPMTLCLLCIKKPQALKRAKYAFVQLRRERCLGS